MITPEEKLLRLVIKEQMQSRSYPVKQETPVCPKCHKTIDILDFSVSGDYREIQIGNRAFTVFDPTCPECGVKVTAEVNVTS